MSNSVMVIPRAGENKFYDSVSAASRDLGLSIATINTAIENGSEIQLKGKHYCFDYAFEEPDEVAPKKRQYPAKYELIDTKTDKVHKFSNYLDIAKFCKRSSYYVEQVLKSKKEFVENITGEVYKLRIIA